MRASRFFISTLKDAPSDAEIVSHQLMMRAGMIKRLGSGIYTYMPMGLRVIRKVEAIVREEMNQAAAIELLMPLVQPAELWQETGRWDKMGAELMRVKDRHGREYAIQPTSEEVITDVVRTEIKSYRQLPLNIYHIQTKFLKNGSWIDLPASIGTGNVKPMLQAGSLFGVRKGPESHQLSAFV